MRTTAALLFAVIASQASAQTTIHNDDSCDIGVAPAATLLLPYFEVDVASPPEEALTTIFSITNVTRDPQIARVTLWSDWTYPVLTFNVFLTGYDVQSVNLYDVLVHGRIAQTSNVTRPGPFSRGATRNSSRAHVLIGDFQLVHPHRALGNQAIGEPMVHIRAIPEGGMSGSLADTELPYTFYDRYTPFFHRRADRRQPLPSAFAARYIQGGVSGFGTNFMIWREGLTGTDAVCSSYVKNREIFMSELVRFDERENATTNVPTLFITFTPPRIAMPAVARVASTHVLIPPLTSGDVAGWMYLNLHDSDVWGFSTPRSRVVQNWVFVGMEAEGRFGVASAAVPLGNGCSPITPFAWSTPIGPRP